MIHIKIHTHIYTTCINNLNLINESLNNENLNNESLKFNCFKKGISKQVHGDGLVVYFLEWDFKVWVVIRCNEKSRTFKPD